MKGALALFFLILAIFSQAQITVVNAVEIRLPWLPFVGAVPPAQRGATTPPSPPTHRSTQPPSSGVVVDPTQPINCLLSFGAESVCYFQIASSFFTRQISIGPDCCRAIAQTDQTCRDTIFAQFNNPLFAVSILEHCHA